VDAPGGVGFGLVLELAEFGTLYGLTVCALLSRSAPAPGDDMMRSAANNAQRTTHTKRNTQHAATRGGDTATLAFMSKQRFPACSKGIACR
jgi:hypothetical protein